MNNSSTSQVPNPVPPVVLAAEQMLRTQSYPDLRKLKCHFNEGVLTVEGQLPSFHLKQVAQSILLRVDGVHCVLNKIDVPSRVNSAAQEACPLESVTAKQPAGASSAPSGGRSPE